MVTPLTTKIKLFKIMLYCVDQFEVLIRFNNNKKQGLWKMQSFVDNSFNPIKPTSNYTVTNPEKHVFFHTLE